MLSSLIMVAIFCAGIVCGHWELLPQGLITEDHNLFVLWLLLICVGISIGAEKRLRAILSAMDVRFLLFPVFTTIGTFLGAFVASFMVSYTLPQCLAVGAGFAYYSLSSVLISQVQGAELGTVALISNISREIIALLSIPILGRFLPAPAVIAPGGATTMDTTLPIITRTLGKEWVFIAIFHAIILDFSVPFWVMFFCSF